jgi:murein DD-endopeptidase MepM/ murein hydrolase activator NlpD
LILDILCIDWQGGALAESSNKDILDVGGEVMKSLRGVFHALLAQQTGQLQLLIIAPILTLSFLSLVVRTASSAVDPALQKKKVVEQIKQRLIEVQKLEEDLAIIVESTPPPVPAAQLAQEHEPAAPTQLQTSRSIRKGATLTTILKEAGLSRGEVYEWVAAVHKLKEFRHLRAGRTLTLSLLKAEEAWTLASLSYQLNQESTLFLQRKADGRIHLTRRTLPTTLAWRAAGGRIHETLYAAAVSAGVPARIVDQLADLDWDLDFSSDLRSGDTFRVIFEEFQHNGRTVRSGRVLAAELINRGKKHTYYWMDNKSTEAKFLRYPLQFTRISSVFSDARFHPLLKQRRPHRGVDFAAPSGTPVRAVASGAVTFAGWQGGYGRFIRIDHPGPYDSAYAHLRSIAKGIKVRAKVKRGQIIGYVGSTGMATGPHLHFELHKNGKYINPLTAKLPTESPISEQTRQQQVKLAKEKQYLAKHLAAITIKVKPSSRILAADTPPTESSPSNNTRPSV